MSSSSSSAMISSQGVMLAAAMLFSSTIIFLAFSREKLENSIPTKSTPPSCLHSEEKRKQRRKKRVCFAGNVKETKGNGEEYRKEQRKKAMAAMEEEVTKVERICRNQMPANRIALYDGILRDRIHRIQSSC